MKPGAAQAFVNVIIPFDDKYSDGVDRLIKQLTDPAKGNRPIEDLTRVLNAMDGVHFMSITVANKRCPDDAAEMEDAAEHSHLIIEMVVDGATDTALTRLAKEMEGALKQLLDAAYIECDSDSDKIASLFIRHSVVIRDSWGRGALGQTFNGSPGQSLLRIRREQKLANRIGNEIEKLRREREWSWQTPMERLDAVRQRLWDHDAPDAAAGDLVLDCYADDSSPNADVKKWAFMSEATPCLGPKPDETRAPTNPQIWKVVATILVKFGWPIYVAALLAIAVLWWPMHYGQTGAVSVMWGLTALSVWAVSIGITYWLMYLLLRYLERHDAVVDRTPDAGKVEELLAVENFTAQNHLASVSRLKKPYWFRKLTLRLAFVVVGTGRFIGKPGFLGKNGVIHFARWMLMPRTNQMLFWSNFDGTWAAYVGDFIADAPTGVTAIWGNCYGFPRTRRLSGGGAQDRDRLVRWARRQQHPTRFWYSAYQDLTAERIRINAAIRQGIASAQSEADAEDWLALFGSMVSPPDLLKMTEIPIVVFGGLSNMRHATSHIVRFNADKDACKAWLKRACIVAAYGEMVPGQPSAVLVGLTCSGLEKLGVPPEAIATFPVAFQQGMSTPSRARALADLGESAPEKWIWGRSAQDVDAVVVVYGVEPEDLNEAWELLKDGLEKNGHSVIATIPLRELPPRPPQPGASTSAPPNGKSNVSQSASADKKVSPTSGRSNEPFGFADGVSQPVLKGTAHSHATVDPDHLIETGEIVLGYPDNLKRFPPSPTIAGEYDPDRFLPNELTDWERNRPDFGRYRSTGRRDLGANGTFLVVRQLEQHVARFNEYVGRVAVAAASGNEGISVAIDSTGAIAILGGHPAMPWLETKRTLVELNLQLFSVSASATDGRSPPVKILTSDNATEADMKALEEFIAARMVGRWKDGTSLVRNPRRPGTRANPNAMPDNDFRFGEEDPRGLGCPFGAHIRRANPRDTRFPGMPEEIVETNRHRMLRIGRSWESSDNGSKKEGLLFMCLNADIERQFEFVQKSWLMNPHLHGLEDESDPMVGTAAIHDPKKRLFTVQTTTGPARMTHLPDFVKVVGGAYCFLPSRAALRYLAEGPL